MTGLSHYADADICVSDAEWTSIRVMPAMQNIAARATSRAFVGLPLCLCIHLQFDSIVTSAANM